MTIRERDILKHKTVKNAFPITELRQLVIANVWQCL